MLLTVAALCCFAACADCFATLMLVCREVDMCLSELAGAVPVEVMPGNNDPANHSLPQQPLHRCLFPLASSFTSFNR